MADEGYNGWANWDTWEAYNWLTSEYESTKHLESVAWRLSTSDFEAEARPYLESVNDHYQREYGEPDLDLSVVDWESLRLHFADEDE